MANAEGHDEGEWVEEEKGIVKLLCTKCGELLDTKINNYVGLRGDINGSGDIDSMDYVLLKRYYFNTFDLDSDAMLRADVDCNEVVDSMDYVVLKRAYFGSYVIQEPLIYR